MTTLTNYEGLLALSTSPHLTPVMREYLVKVLEEHRLMRAALREIDAAPTIGGISAGERKGLQRAAAIASSAITKAKI